MGRWIDAITLGPARRRRHMRRALASIDRQDEVARLRGQDPLSAWTPPTAPQSLRAKRRARSSGTVTTRSADRKRRAVSISAAVLVVGFLVVELRYPSWLGAQSAHHSTASPLDPPPGVGEHKKPLGTPQTPPAGSGGFAFENTQPGTDTPVTWDPCRAIHYVIAGQPPAGASGMVGDAVARMSVATGLQFVYDGPTQERLSSQDRPDYQPGRYGKRWVPLIIDWTNPADDPNLSQDIIGLGGPDEMINGNQARVYVSGSVALNSAALEGAIISGHGSLAEAVVLHELGHALGLAHVSDPTQIMYPEAHIQTTTLGAGDLRGLARLGEGRCFPDL